MIQDIYRVGLCAKRGMQSTPLEEDLMPNMKVKLDGIIAIELDRDGKYKGLRIMESSAETLLGILLKKKAPMGPNYSPTAQITEIEKTLSVKIIGWFKNYGNIKNDTDNQVNIIQDSYRSLTVSEKDIISDYDKLNLKKGSYALTIIYDNMLPLHIPFVLNRYSEALRRKSEAVGLGTCSLCGNPNSEIIVKSNVFKFFTDDKPGNISGGFNGSRVWMNYPVCRNCETILARGKAYTWDNLKFQWYGLSYYLVPSTRSLSTLEELAELLEDIIHRKLSLNEKTQKSVQSTSLEIWDIITENSDINSFHLLFIQSEQSGSVERILLKLNDIYPSRIKRLFSGKKSIDTRFSLADKGFNFGYIRKFFLKSDRKNRKNDLDSFFLEITRSVFLQVRIDPLFLLSHFMREIRDSFVNESDISFKQTALNALISLEYLAEINCINFEGRIDMSNPLDDLFQRYGKSMDTDLKRALFLIGALAAKVMEVQYINLKSTPFQNRLRELKMRQEHVEGLLNECINKLREYDSYYESSRQIVAIISRLLLQTPAVWPLTVNQINFFISTGMALSKEVYTKFKKKENDDSKEGN